MTVFGRFKSETWCKDLAYVDKLERDNNGVKYSLVRQDLFDRTVDAKEMNEDNELEGNGQNSFEKDYQKD